MSVESVVESGTVIRRRMLERQDVARDLGTRHAKSEHDAHDTDTLPSAPSNETSTKGPLWRRKRLPARTLGRPGDLYELDNEFTVIETHHHSNPRNNSVGKKHLRGRALLSTSQASPARGSGGYRIKYKYVSPGITPAMEAAFDYAAARLGKMITSRFPVARTRPDLRCSGVPKQQLPSELNELFIFVNVTEIDGTNKKDNILGQAGPCLIDDAGFPRVGYVEFDIADVQKMVIDQTFDAVCVHEILHIIGFGTLWQTSELNLLGGSNSDPRYMGKFGVEALPSVNASFMGTPPVQDTGGEGTALSHWRDSIFGDEMMTAYLSATYQPLSALTVESLRDLGYTVDSSVADTYFAAPSSNVANVPPSWFNSGFWNTTTIWVIAVAGATFLVFLVSCIVVRIRRKPTPTKPPTTTGYPTPMTSRPSGRPPNPPVAQPVYVGGPAAYDIPVAQPYAAAQPAAVYLVPEHDLGMFMEITGCRDRNQALKFMRDADNNVSRAVDRYLHVNGATMAVV